MSLARTLVDKFAPNTRKMLYEPLVEYVQVKVIPKLPKPLAEKGPKLPPVAVREQLVRELFNLPESSYMELVECINTDTRFVHEGIVWGANPKSTRGTQWAYIRQAEPGETSVRGAGEAFSDYIEGLGTTSKYTCPALPEGNLSAGAAAPLSGMITALGQRGKYYHLSPYRFERFKAGARESWRGATEIGFHVGTRQTATTVADKLYQQGRIQKGDPVYLYEVDLKTTSPLELGENRIGSWSIHRILQEIFDAYEEGQAPFITDEEADKYYDGYLFAPSGEDILALSFDPDLEQKEFVSWLSSKGFDSISYDNVFEGGGYSHIVFDPDDVSIVRVEEMTA